MRSWKQFPFILDYGKGKLLYFLQKWKTLVCVHIWETQVLMTADYLSEEWNHMHAGKDSQGK